MTTEFADMDPVIAAAFVVGTFEDTIAKIVALAVFSSQPSPTFRAWA